jgi:hypothetical protein
MTESKNPSNYEQVKAQAKAFLDSRPSVYFGDEDVEPMLREITYRARAGEQESIDFLNSLPWEDVEVPDPGGWCNQY